MARLTERVDTPLAHSVIVTRAHGARQQFSTTGSVRAMASSTVDLTAARREAHELRASVKAGDRAAIDRVLASHPKYAGRPESRLRTNSFSQGDALAVIARERGYDSWRALCADGDEPGAVRWRPTSPNVYDRAVQEARQRDDVYCGDHHLLLAVLQPPEPTIASRVLATLGLRADEVAAQLPRGERTREDDSLVLNPAFQMSVAFAQALALAQGIPVGDEHVLLTLMYRNEGETLTSHDIDPDEAYDELARHGVIVPAARPPVARTPLGPFGPRVYLSGDDFSAVIDALSEQSGSTRWGWNVSQWRPGQYWIDSEDEIDAAAIVRAAVADASLVDVVPFEVASRAEREALETDAG